MSNVFDMLEKIKELNERECRSYIANNINYIYKEATLTQFVWTINQYNKYFKNGESDIIDILKSKNIPYILANSEYQDEISQQLIELNTYKAYKEGEYVEALEGIKLLSQKYSLNLNTYILKGDILKKLGNYNEAIDAYNSTIEFKSYDLSVKRKILSTRLSKYKKEIMLITVIILIVGIGQYILFNKGIITPKLTNFNIQIAGSPHSVEDKNTIAIPVGGTINYQIDYQLKPFYAYEGMITYKIGDEEIVKLDENQNLTGLKEGETTLEVLREGETVHTYNLIVAQSKVEQVDFSLDGTLEEVGDKAQINVNITRNYDFESVNQVTYQSSDVNVLTVNDEGIVEITGGGIASIIVSCEDVSKEEEVIIDVKVEDIKVTYDIDIEVEDEYALEVEVVTNSTKTPPKAVFALEENNSEPAISINGDGKIKGLREGTQTVIVSSGEIEKQILVTVRPKSISKYQVENVKSTSTINQNILDIGLAWDKIDLNDNFEYEIHGKFHNESEFKKLGVKTKDNTNFNIKYDLSNFKGSGQLELFVVAKNVNGQSKPSNTVSIGFSN